MLFVCLFVVFSLSFKCSAYRTLLVDDSRLNTDPIEIATTGRSIEWKFCRKRKKCNEYMKWKKNDERKIVLSMLEFLNRFERNRAGAMFCVALFRFSLCVSLFLWVCCCCRLVVFFFYSYSQKHCFNRSLDRCILYRCEFHERVCTRVVVVVGGSFFSFVVAIYILLQVVFRVSVYFCCWILPFEFCHAANVFLLPKSKRKYVVCAMCTFQSVVLHSIIQIDRCTGHYSRLRLRYTHI